MVQALAEGFRLGAGELFVPQEYAWMGAIGCALLEREQRNEPLPTQEAPPALRIKESGQKRMATTWNAYPSRKYCCFEIIRKLRGPRLCRATVK